MKILLVSDNYYPYPGGISEHVYHLYLEFRRRGHIVNILTGQPSWYVEDNPDIIRVGRYVKAFVNKSFNPTVTGIDLYNRVRYVVNKNNYDIVHIHGPIAPFLPIYTLMTANAPRVATFHAAFERNIYYKIFNPLFYHFFKRLDGQIAVSRVAKESMIKYFPGEYRIIPNGIDINRFSPNVKPIEKYLDGKINILFVGRLEPRKGIRTLFQAMNKVVRKNKNVRLIVVGKGALKNLYSYGLREAKDYVVFEHFVPFEELPRYYATCDIFCSPATGNESFGIVLLEAMASGKPVVATSIPGYRDVVRNGIDGKLVPPRNPYRLAVALLNFIKDPTLREKMGKEGRKRSLSYSWDNVSRQVEEFYKEVIDKSSYKYKKKV